MENAEEVLQCLDEFSKMKPKDIPRELEEYLCFVAKTGDPVYQWSLVKSLFREKLINVVTEFYESCPSVEIPPCPNVETFNYDVMKNFILEKLESFAAAPFTVQRICELLTTPRKEYNRIDKYMRALEKNILVVSTREPGQRRSTENGDSILNGLETDTTNSPIKERIKNVHIDIFIDNTPRDDIFVDSTPRESIFNDNTPRESIFIGNTPRDNTYITNIMTSETFETNKTDQEDQIENTPENSEENQLSTVSDIDQTKTVNEEASVSDKMQEETKTIEDDKEKNTTNNDELVKEYIDQDKMEPSEQELADQESEISVTSFEDIKNIPENTPKEENTSEVETTLDDSPSIEDTAENNISENIVENECDTTENVLEERNSPEITNSSSPSTSEITTDADNTNIVDIFKVNEIETKESISNIVEDASTVSSSTTTADLCEEMIEKPEPEEEKSEVNEDVPVNENASQVEVSQ